MKSEHRALIHWSRRQEEIGLPDTSETIDPAWIEPGLEEAWSLICRFESPPVKQGNPSEALVTFLVDAAPHDHLFVGARLQLFERETQQCAQVEILD